MKFDEMGLSPDTLKSVQALGFETATPIQEQAIPILLKGDRDFVGLASTGTGKTAAFGLPLLERIDPDQPFPQGIILCPTRELCLQIASDLNNFSKHRSNLKVTAVYGGSPIVSQIRDLKRGTQIIVATPGRLLDLIERRAAKLDQVSMVVLDEADEMLNMGFKEELDKILGRMPEERVTWLFSATMAKGVARIAQNYQTDPVEVSVGGRNEAAANIEHLCFMVHEKDRYQALKRILDFLPEIYGLVFCRTRAETQQVAEKLMQDGYSAESLHGDLSQAQRDAVMRKFRQKSITILVATDVAARGLDVDDITHVIQYKLSDEIQAYTHRSGRTARAGKSGVSISLINMHERRRIADLERRNNIKINLEKIPDGKAICENQLIALLNKVIESPVNEKEIEDYLPLAYEALCQLDKKEIIKRFVSVEFNHFLEYYRHAGDINVKPRANDSRSRDQGRRSDNRNRGPRPESSDSKRFSINMGRANKINAGAIVRIICENCGIASNQVGEISLGHDQSFFDVKKESANAVREGMNNVKLDGRKVSIRAATPQGGGQGGPRQRSGRQGHPGGRRR
ncbi:MAG: DEAD/DEAH box helicase [Verrucomicrobia bacterium]|nr:DEAD/DEAH box helicase [Verrucomicrobiota bacterium]